MASIMTMIPRRIKALPGLRKAQPGNNKIQQQSSSHSNRSLYMGGQKMIR